MSEGELVGIIDSLNKTLKRQRAGQWVSVVVAIALAAAGGYFSALAGVREGLAQVSIRVAEHQVRIDDIKKQQDINTSDIKVILGKR